MRCRSLGCENPATDEEFCLPCSFARRTDPSHEVLRVEIEEAGAETKKLLADLLAVLENMKLVSEAMARAARAIVDAADEVQR